MIDNDDLELFDQLGFFTKQNFINGEMCNEIKSVLDYNFTYKNGDKKLLPNSVIKDLILSDDVIKSLNKVCCDADFKFHHAHGRCLDKNGEGKVWHHDYDGVNGWKRGMPKMIHVMIYPDGLTKDFSPLVVKPSSHLNFVKRDFPNKNHFNVSAEDSIVQGSAGLCVFLNSALWHMRPPNFGISKRYDLNISFCEVSNDNSWRWSERESYRHILDLYAKDSKLFW